MLLGGKPTEASLVEKTALLAYAQKRCGICRGACYCYDDDNEETE